MMFLLTLLSFLPSVVLATTTLHAWPTINFMKLFWIGWYSSREIPYMRRLQSATLSVDLSDCSLCCGACPFYTFYNYMIFTFLKTIVVSSRCWSFPRDIGRKRECLGLTWNWGEFSLLRPFVCLQNSLRILLTCFSTVCNILFLYLLVTIVSRSFNVCSSLRSSF